MQYYDEHNTNETILSILKVNILKKTIDSNLENNNKFYIEQDGKEIEINNNRAFHGDEVYICDNKVIAIKNRVLKDTSIIGILYLDSKMKYNNLIGKKMFLFKPTDKKISHFYVTYTLKPSEKLQNIYCLVQFKEWTIYQKLPHGIVLEKIGLIGEREVEYEHLRIYYGLRNTTIKIDKDLKKEHQKILDDLNESVVEYEVFSIDPPESKDIDDAFHFKKILEGDIDKEYEIGIHISCPYYFFKDMLDKIMDIGTTVYMPHKIYNMLPVIYSENYVSLIQGEKRHALSLILRIDGEYNLMAYEIKPCIIKNINKGNYDDFQRNYSESSVLKKFVEVSSCFFKTIECESNSHKLVELWMIYANKKIAEHLLKNNISGDMTNIILRSHQSVNSWQNIEYEDLRLTEYLKIRHENSAKYVLYCETGDSLSYVHSKLGNDYYTHFTSPIRRVIDLFIHGLLLIGKDLYEKRELEEKLIRINDITKRSRKLDRTVKRLEFLYKLKEKCTNIETYGYIIEFNKDKMSCSVYIPEYKLEETVYLVPHKFKSIVKFEIKYEQNAESFFVEYEDKSREFTLYKKVNLKLWIFLSAENIFDNLRIEIID
jgi:exoribonuclease R